MRRELAAGEVVAAVLPVATKKHDMVAVNREKEGGERGEGREREKGRRRGTRMATGWQWCC